MNLTWRSRGSSERLADTIQVRRVELWLFVWLVPSLAALGISGTVSSDSSVVAKNLDVQLFVVGASCSTLMGILVTVSVAVAAWIDSQGVNSRQQGFGRLRAGVRSLSRLSQLAFDESRRVTQPELDWLRRWSASTDELVDRLNEITPFSEGWDGESDLETRFAKYLEATAEVAQATGEYLVHDPVGSQLRIDQDSSLREIVLGLLNLSEAARANRLLKRLVPLLFSSLLALLVGLVLGIVSGLASNTQLGAYLVLSSLAFTVFVHFSWLLLAMRQWWLEKRQLEEHWGSSLQHLEPASPIEGSAEPTMHTPRI